MAVEPFYEELKRYVGFSSEDASLLARARVLVEHRFGEIAGLFYERIRAHEHALAVFRDEAQIERQKRALVGWLARVFTGPYDAQFYTETSKIGHVHVAVGLPQRYMLTGMTVIRGALIDALTDAGVDERSPMTRAVHVVLDLELAVMLESYFSALLRRAQEAERAEALRRAERLTSVGILAAGLAHEIRNPLNGAQLHLTFLERGLQNGAQNKDELKEAVGVVKGEIQRLSNLVTEFLDFARPRPLDARCADVRDVCERGVNLVAGEAQQAGVELSYQKSRSPLLADLDVDKFTQVLLNLLRNAIEAIEPGKKGQVSVRTLSAEGKILVEVEDDGPGIPDPSTPVFDPFFTTKDQGSGLGLSIAHRIVTDHDGALRFSSVPGKTVFTIALPKAAGTATVAASQR